MGNFLSKTITGAAEGAFVGAAGGAVIGTFAVPVVGTVAGAAFGAITGAVGGTMLGAIDAFFTKPKTCRTLLSAEQYPPISTVLANNGRIDLLDSIRSAIKSGNPKAAMNVEKQLEDLALDHIIEAFKRGLIDGMHCYKCHKAVTNVDDLCYCPGAAKNCHHNNKCCNYKNYRGKLTYY